MIKYLCSPWLNLLVCAGIFLPLTSRADLWCTAYFPGYNDGNAMAPSNIDFSVVTHVVHFSAVPQSDGSLDMIANSITTQASVDIITVAHAANRKALICVGGAGSFSFPNACSAANITNFVSNIISLMSGRGYDGVDIDWEPYDDASDATLYTNLVTRLRAAMNAVNSHLILTTALTLPNPWDATTLPATITSVVNKFDQINLQTYDLSGPYPGWIAWHNSAIYDNGVTLPGNLQAPSVNGAVMRFITNGIPAAKLGLGVTFHGQVWNGEAIPGQSLTLTGSQYINPISYNDIVANYSASPHFWDAGAVAPYISITNSTPANSIFISYDDARACESKVSYARNHGLGGMIIWELKQDHTASSPDPLLNAVKQALATPGRLTPQQNGPNLNLSFSVAPLGSYSVQWNTNLTTPIWNTLSTTNATNTTGVVQIQTSDSIPSNGKRFYRVKTPP